MKTVWQNEPIIIIGILVGLVPAVMGVLAAFGVEITSAQIAAVASLLTAIGAAVARSQVTPNAATSSGDPPTVNGAPGAPPKDGSVPPVLRPMKRLALAWACALLVSTISGCTAAEQKTANDIIAGVCVPVVSEVPVVGPMAPVACVVLEDLIAEAEAYELAHGTKPTLTTTAKGETVVPAEMYAGLQRRSAARRIGAGPYSPLVITPPAMPANGELGKKPPAVTK
jgi:hypothetical protein